MNLPLHPQSNLCKLAASLLNAKIRVCIQNNKQSQKNVFKSKELTTVQLVPLESCWIRFRGNDFHPQPQRIDDAIEHVYAGSNQYNSIYDVVQGYKKFQYLTTLPDFFCLLYKKWGPEHNGTPLNC